MSLQMIQNGDKINGKELVCISCSAGHVILNKWVISTTQLKWYIATNDSAMTHVAMVEVTRTYG